MAASSGVRGDIRDIKARRAISQTGKEELEDKYYRLMEENLALKKYSRSQEEKMKKMATKLLRLTSDEKKETVKGGLFLHKGVAWNEALESELDDALARNRELEKQNTSMKSKMMVLKQQLESQGRRHTPYDHVQSRISTGIKKKGQRSVSTEDISVKRPAGQDATTQSSASCHNILEEVRKDNQELEDQLLQLRHEVSTLRAERERAKEKQRLRMAQSEEERLKMQDELLAQINVLQKENTESEMNLLKARRELRDRHTRLEALQTKHTTLERNNDLLKTSHSRVLQEMELLNQQLKEERQRTSQLMSESHDSRLSQRTISELRETVEELRAERDRLRDSNNRLTKRQGEAVSEKEQQLREQLRTAQQKLREVESDHKKELLNKSKIITELSVERELSESLDRELKDLRSTYLQLKQDYDQLQDKLSFFSKESSVDWSEVEEALVMVRQGKVNGVGVLSSLAQSEAKSHQDIQELRATLADTINELEKTRQLLQIQHTINKEYKSEVESLKCRMVERNEENSSQLKEYAQLLDIKAARIRKLENQLKDIAYGTRQVKLDTQRFEYEGEGEGESVHLERGQNLLQFHIAQVSLSNEAVSCLHTSSPALFVVFGFSDYETQVTPVRRGVRSHFGFTTNFVVTVDDSFLQHLHKGSVSLEVNQGLGCQYQTLAVASVRCKDLILSSGSRVSGKVSLTGVQTLRECVSVGTLEYWMRLKLPVSQAFQLYQEQSKALAAIDGGPHTVTPHTPSQQSAHDPDYNELVITVHKCHGLDSAHTGDSPSCYVMYKFYSFPDHDTGTVTHSLSPRFDDRHSYPVSMNQHLSDYLSTEGLEVYVFDDASEGEGYLGLARVPLHELAQGQPLSGTYQLFSMKEEPCGYVDLSLRWKHPYHTPTPPTPPLIVTHPHTPTHLSTSHTPAPPTSVEVAPPPQSKPTKQPVSTKDKPIETKPSTIKKPQGKRTDKNQLDKPTTQHSRSAEHSPVKVPVMPLTDEESSALSESDSLSVQSGRSGKTNTSKKVVKISRHKAPSHTRPSKRSKGLKIPAPAKEDADPTPALANSLPPLRQEPPSIKPAVPEPPRNVPKPLKTDNHSQPPAQPVIPQALPTDTPLHVKKETPVEQNISESDKVQPSTEADSNGEVSITDTESVLSTLSGLLDLTRPGDQAPPTQAPPTQPSPVVLAVSSQLSLTPTDSHVSSEVALVEPGTGAVVRSEGGGAREGSVGVEGEEIEEVLSEDESDNEDTMFEDPLHQSVPGSFDALSELSDHSSDVINPSLPTLTPSHESHPPPPSQKSHPPPPSLTPTQDQLSDNEDLSDITPSVNEQQDGDPITSNSLTAVSESMESITSSPPQAAMSITVESFTLEADSLLEKQSGLSNLFVEYQFLDFDFGELETPTSLPIPASGESITFNFRKDFQLNSHQMELLADMLKPGDPSGGRIVFTVVGDPEDQEADCEEVGTAEVDLNKILQTGQDLHSEYIDVVNYDSAETVGFLTVTVQALETLRRLSAR